MASAAPDARSRLEQIVRESDATAMPEVVAAIRNSGSLDYSRKVAERYAKAADDAIAALPSNPWSDALGALTRYAIDRNH
jgi:octaprenyl-diphosphate synthase